MNATLKLLMAALAATVLSACASNTTTDAGTDDVSDDGASTVIVEDTSATDSGYDADPEAGLVNIFYFDFDQSSLTYETRAALDAYAAVLTSNPRSIRLEGHADERGTREYNIALGERRAQAIADYLISSGVSGGLIETVSYGEERPAVPGTGDSAWSQNRRVELK